MSRFFSGSVWLPLCIGMAAAVVMNPRAGRVEAMLGWKSVMSSANARIAPGSLASSKFTFTIFVFYILLLAARLAGASS